MNKKAKRSFVIALILGLGAFGIGYQNSERLIRWDSPDFINRVATKEFIAEHDDHVNVELLVQKNLLPPEAVCAFKWEFSQKPCEKGDWLMDFLWHVKENGKIVSSGNSYDYRGGSMSDAEYGRIIADFPVEAGKKYELTLESQNDLAPLLAAKPHLLIAANYNELNGQRGIATILMTIATIAFFAGVCNSAKSRKIYLLGYTVRWLLILLIIYGVLHSVTLMMGLGTMPAIVIVAVLGFYKFSKALSSTPKDL